VTKILRQPSGDRDYPVASASWYAPVPGRTLAALSIRCPRWRGIHIGRVSPGTKPDGKRRTPCGPVIVTIRRRYGTRSEGDT
jgi:hypothetical protein